MEKIKILFIDRDGTLIEEAAPSYQINSFQKLVFYPDVFFYVRKIATEFNYRMVMVSNQDGLGTDYFPEDNFWPVQDFILNCFKNEKINFSEVLFDFTMKADNIETRKPGTGLLKSYMDNAEYDLAKSYVIGDRLTDMKLAENLGCKGFWLNNGSDLGMEEINNPEKLIKETVKVNSPSWKEIYNYLLAENTKSN